MNGARDTEKTGPIDAARNFLSRAPWRPDRRSRFGIEVGDALDEARQNFLRRCYWLRLHVGVISSIAR